MYPDRVSINPCGDTWQTVKISEELIVSYHLEEWAGNFSLMTAGYRDQLDPADVASPEVAFNLLTIAILGEAKARVFMRKLAKGDLAHVHVGGETRPHTQDFICVLSRVYAAHDIKVHLRAHVATTPIWYSSFGVFYEGFQSGDNLTASHSPFFKGGWKPLDSDGKQLLMEEKELISEVQGLVKNKATIHLAPWSSKNILRDFDVDDAYVRYQKSIIGVQSIVQIKQTASKGFRCAICPAGGSMKTTTERLFPLFGIPTGEDGVVQYFLGEEDSQYHKIGQIDGNDFGPDPGKPEVYRNIGAQAILLKAEANVVFIWDPDGDRFNIITIAPADRAGRAANLGLEVELFPRSDRCIVYFTPNQIFFMLTAHRMATLKSSGLLNQYDWVVVSSISTSRAVDELARLENIPVAHVRVGFKYMGTFAEWAEKRADTTEPHIDPTGDKVFVGKNLRALVMCEESGGATFGGQNLFMNKTGTRGLIAMREKDGMQLALLTLSLAAFLHNADQSFADYYCDLITKHNIKNRYFKRRDIRLYDESLMGVERQVAKQAGLARQERIMSFFQDLAHRFASGNSADQLGDEINTRLTQEDRPLPRPRRISFIGDGTLLEYDRFWCLIRASGTDALLRYYIEGEDKGNIEAYQTSLINIRV